VTTTEMTAPPPTAALPPAETTTAYSPRLANRRVAFGFVAPFVVLYLLFVILPALYGLLMSFFDTSLVRSGLGKFAGFGNYTEVMGSSDFWQSMWHTVLFTILTTPPLVILSLFFALLAERAARGRWFFRLAFFAPYILPSAVMALIWIWIYTPTLGLLDSALAKINITAPAWLGDPNWAMTSIAISTVWWTLGFNFVLYLAGLQEIPRELYEAAAIDGAGPWQQIRTITIPMLSRTTTLVVVLQVLASLKVFDQMYIMTAGGPNFSTRPALEYIYDIGFTDYRVGAAAAASTLFFVLVLAASSVWLILTRRQERLAS
jgi:multiple sugar transport system permease protein